ncbi:peptidase M15A [Leptolyngbya sp. AN02str]|uniref:peptidase M15A n=1 Tax=Leptolyngbya sp. AN02str TaxID=3423363 RepID=UPI003D31CD6F
MASLTAEQRNQWYQVEAMRAGIHAPLLAALYKVSGTPTLTEGDTGLGISPANKIGLEQLATFGQQVFYAANTIRSMTNRAIALGWKGKDIWDEDTGRYSTRFLGAIAEGYVPEPRDYEAARLEATDLDSLQQIYANVCDAAYRQVGLPENLSFVDAALLRFVEEVPTAYKGIHAQRHALMEGLRLWRKVDSSDDAIAALAHSLSIPLPTEDLERDRLVMTLIRTIPEAYAGFPHQREALLRLVQLWRQLPSREGAIASLEHDSTADTPLDILDAPLMRVVQSIPRRYQGKGEQRNMLTEAYRLWYGLESRADAISQLGIDPTVLATAKPEALVKAARQLDRELLLFIKHMPTQYRQTDEQRQALLKLAQLWQGCETQPELLQTLLDDLLHMERAPAQGAESPLVPRSLPLATPPATWTPGNLQLFAPIVSGGTLTWADATQGGFWMPGNQSVVDAVVQLAQHLYGVSDRLGRPLRIVAWYCPSFVTGHVGASSQGGGAHDSDRHSLGDAVKFYCEGLTAQQLYWVLDPWWNGGLGRYSTHPYLLHLDLRRHRARWQDSQ